MVTETFQKRQRPICHNVLVRVQPLAVSCYLHCFRGTDLRIGISGTNLEADADFEIQNNIGQQEVRFRIEPFVIIEQRIKGLTIKTHRARPTTVSLE